MMGENGGLALAFLEPYSAYLLGYPQLRWCSGLEPMRLSHLVNGENRAR